MYGGYLSREWDVAADYACKTRNPLDPEGDPVDAILPADLTLRWYKYSPVRYWNLIPSRDALQRERHALRKLTGPEQCFKPLPTVIEEINMQMRGWANYFSLGYPRMALRHINWYARMRLTRHVQRRSQRGYRPPKDVSYHEHFKRMGLAYL